jgi:hypothetical protein
MPTSVVVAWRSIFQKGLLSPRDEVVLSPRTESLKV